MSRQGEKAAAERMCYDRIISFQQVHMRLHETAEQPWAHMQLLQKHIVQNGEPVPQKPVPDAIHHSLIDRGHFRSVTDATRKGIVTTMNTEHINDTLPRRQKILHPVMDSIEESLPVERTALKYDCQPHHFLFLNIDETNAVILYTATVKPGLPIL